MGAVTDYQEVAATLPDEVFLGQLVYFTICEADVELEKMRVELESRDLRTTTLRKRLRPIDAFKKAANEIANKFAKTTTAQHSFMVRAVGQDAETSHRHVVLERAMFSKGKRRHLAYDNIATLVYDRGVRQKDGTIKDDQITVTVNTPVGYTLTAEEQAWLDSHIGADGAKVIERYTHWCNNLDSHAIRSFVREYLYELSGIQVKRNGGVYFVAQKHADELRSLSEFVKSIGSDMHLIPLLDIVDQRDMLKKAFENETIDEVDSLMAELSKILATQSRTITPDTYDEYVAKAADLIARADEYEQLLGDTLDTAKIRIDTFKTQVLTLSSRVKVPKRMRKKTT